MAPKVKIYDVFMALIKIHMNMSLICTSDLPLSYNNNWFGKLGSCCICIIYRIIYQK